MFKIYDEYVQEWRKHDGYIKYKIECFKGFQIMTKRYKS